MTKEEKHKRHLQNLEIVRKHLDDNDTFQKRFGGKSEEEIIEECRKLRNELWENKLVNMY